MATTIDVISGFLGAGKTTLIKKLLKDGLQGEKVVLIENEFGEIGIDTGFLQDAGIKITEMNSGCICCTLVGDFARSLEEVLAKYSPDRILIEPSGVGKLSDVTAAVRSIADKMSDVIVGGSVTVADVGKCKMYMKNFGEFYNNQIESAGTIVLSRTQNVSEEKIEACIALLREHNANAVIITTPWDQLEGAQILEAMGKGVSLEEELFALLHHDDDDDEECECGHHHHHHHHDDEEECECGHHHHHDDDDDDEDEDEHEHHHHHHHHDGEECSCGHHHHHHHGHDADEVFTSWGFETARKYTAEEIQSALTALDGGEYGAILRAKGYVDSADGWIHFDYVPEEPEIRRGSAQIIGKICVIGSKLDEEKLAVLFRR